VPDASSDIRERLLAAPTPPYTATMLLRSNAIGANNQYCGPCFRESGTGKLYIFYVLVDGTIQAAKWTDNTTFDSVGAVGTTAPIVTHDYHWLRIGDDGTDLTFALSTDGQNYFVTGSEGRTVFMAGGPDQIGFFANVDSAAGAFSMSVASFDVQS
jgi:hypothetical protein